MTKPKVAPVPEPPKQQNEYFYENDQLRSYRVFDPARNGYISKSVSSPQEREIEKFSTGYINDLMKKLPGAVNLSPEAIQGYKDAYTKPQIDALNESYNQASGELDMAGAGAGMRNSVGFNDYKVGKIERNRAQGLADIQANAKQIEYDIPNKILQPFVNQFNLVNAALSGQQAQMAQDLEPSFQGSQAGTNAANQLYQNQLNAYQLNQQNQQKRGGLFSFLTGG